MTLCAGRQSRALQWRQRLPHALPFFLQFFVPRRKPTMLYSSSRHRTRPRYSQFLLSHPLRRPRRLSRRVACLSHNGRAFLLY